jgi:hypothetical protein
VLDCPSDSSFEHTKYFAKEHATTTFAGESTFMRSPFLLKSAHYFDARECTGNRMKLFESRSWLIAAHMIYLLLKGKAHSGSHVA